MPPQMLKTSYGYQVLAKKTPPITTIRCDTPWKCKANVVANTVTSCTICPDDLGLPASPYYGADLDVEVSPYDQIHLKTISTNTEEPEVGKEEDKGAAGTEGTKALSIDEAKALEEKQKELEKMDPNHGCPPRVEDEFVLPCCMPLRNVVTGELSVKPLVAASVLLEKNRLHRLHRLRLHTTSKLQQDTVVKATLLPCCGTPMSCCRWCKEMCDELEQINLP